MVSGRARRDAAAGAARPTARRATTTTRSRRGGRSIWPWLLALGLIIAGGIGGWFLYTKIQDQLNSNKPVAVPDVMLLRTAARGAEDPGRPG